MSWIVIDLTQSASSLVCCEGGFREENTGREVLLAEVSMILIGDTCNLRSEVLLSAASFGVPVLFCDWRNVPTGVFQPFSTHTRIGRRAQAQASATPGMKGILWKKIIKAKIRGQAAVLRDLGAGGSDYLMDLAAGVTNGDPENAEGRAASFYWHRLFPEFRRERFSEDARNSALNYGYTILRGHCIRAVAAAGLNLSLGIHHHHMSNGFALADDIIEPFRPAVDFAVVSMARDGVLDMENPECKRALVAATHAKMAPHLKTVPSEMDFLSQHMGYVFEKGGDIRVPEWRPTY